jgi:HAAS domain-containing protein
MASEPLEAYLKDLADALTAHGAWDARIIEEARAHLLDAVEAGIRRGVPLAVAEREAVTAFGQPDVVAARAAAERKDHHDWRPHAILNRLLAASCWFTLFATAYLSLSVLIVRPPRLDYSVWFLTAGFFIAQSVLTLVTVSGSVRGNWIRRGLLAGGIAIASAGAWWVHETVSGPHFEGFALVLGSSVAIQGALTVLRLLPIAGPWMIARSN